MTLNTFTSGKNTTFSDELNENFSYIAPIGSILPFHKSFNNTPSLPENWVECNGQTINDSESPYDGQTVPDLNGEQRFIRGSKSSGGTGGRRSTGDASRDGGIIGSLADSGDNQPPYFDMVFIMRIK